jgi:DNA-binding NarL/FixJ family response regulator
MPINVSIVEDDRRIRESLALLLDGGDNIRCISTHPTAEEALAQLVQKQPDVVLMDINLPNMSGIECVRKLKALMPKLQVLMLTMYEDNDLVFQSLMAGASGYLVKRTSSAGILEAIEEVHRGSSTMSAKTARVVVEYFQTLRSFASENEQLTRREHQILDLLVQGYSYKEIAEQLAVTFESVRAHLKTIYEKLHVASRTQAIAKYRK